MTVITGPWAPKNIKQGTGSGWFYRGVDGALIVSDGDSWHRAPVAETQPRVAQPNRPPEPMRITAALDFRGMYGPEVDEALGVPEPTVDEWEAGAQIPTAADVRRLATLTGFAVEWFYRQPPAELSGGFICGTDGCRPLGVPDDVERCPHCGAPRPPRG